MKKVLQIFSALYFATGAVMAAIIYYRGYILHDNLPTSDFEGWTIFFLPAILLFSVIWFFIFWIVVIAGIATAMMYLIGIMLASIVFIFTGKFVIDDTFNLFKKSTWI